MGVTARVSENGEVVLPAEVGRASGWQAGAELEIVRRGGEVVLRAVAASEAVRPEDPFPPITLEDFFARVPSHSGPPVTDEDIEAALSAEAKRRWYATSG